MYHRKVNIIKDVLMRVIIYMNIHFFLAGMVKNVNNTWTQNL